MSKRVVIDPITRIEGHLRVEIKVNDKNVVEDAFVSGTFFKGIELILKGRAPADAPLIAQRICGVCTNAHYRGSIESIENAYKAKLPRNAKLVRDLVSLALTLQDHIIHFYHLHSLDYIDVPKTLEADCVEANKVANKYSKNPYNISVGHLLEIKDKIEKFASSGKLGFLSNAAWGHSKYKLSSEQELIMMSHYFDALSVQRELSKAIATFSSKTPHAQNLVVGGVTNMVELVNPARINEYMHIMKETVTFINDAYMPDIDMFTEVYKDDAKKGEGRGYGNFIAVDSYSLGGAYVPEGYVPADDKFLFEGGVVYDHDFSKVAKFDASLITEENSYSWFEGSGAVDPSLGNSNPKYTGLNSDNTINENDKYSWLKSPRYDKRPVETGPLARMIVGYIKGAKTIKPFIDDFLNKHNLELMDLSSTVGRVVTRAIESKIVGAYVLEFVSTLVENLKYGDTKIYCKPTENKDCKGYSIREVPRGILLHYINVKDGKIENYQVIAPSTWNAGPMDGEKNKGVYEKSLIGTELADINNPIEIYRTIRSYDPCIACAIHIVDAKGRELSEFKIGSNSIV